MLRIAGLKNCDTCRKALKELKEAGVPAKFYDIRDEGNARDIARWLKAAGAEAMINKRSATWRSLTEAQKKAAMGEGALALVTICPTVIKRPVIERGSEVFIGWDAKTRAALLTGEGAGT